MPSVLLVPQPLLLLSVQAVDGQMRESRRRRIALEWWEQCTLGLLSVVLWLLCAGLECVPVALPATAAAGC